jgi:hypothetical protein
MTKAFKSNPNDIGHRDIDRAETWTDARYIAAQSLLAPDYWKQKHEAYPKGLRVPSQGADAVNGLNNYQREFYHVVTMHYLDYLQGKPVLQLLLHLDGRAGTGKSHVIMLISAHLQQMAAEAVGTPDHNIIITATNISSDDVVMRAAPTGVAAHGIQGRTLHALLKLQFS